MLTIGTIYRTPRWRQNDLVAHGYTGPDETRARADFVSSIEEWDDHPNWFHVTAGGPSTAVWSKGIHPMAMTAAPGGTRRPCLYIGSKPGQAGSATTPWHDEIQPSRGWARYFGDATADTPRPAATTAGNAAMLEAYSAHHATTRDERLLAPPIIVMRQPPGRKGFWEFAGVAVIEAARCVVQRDRKGRGFTNFRFDLCLLNLALEDESVDWDWVNDRRNPDLSAEDCLKQAPRSWRRFVEDGMEAARQERRIVLDGTQLAPSEQLPPFSGPDGALLRRVTEYFKGDGHDNAEFEYLAEAVSTFLLNSPGRHSIEFHRGWTTQKSGDGGIDFVGRLDVGSMRAVPVSLVLLGEAKCKGPWTAGGEVRSNAGVNAKELARLVARLRRGWFGVFVTTSYFTVPAQKELQLDNYPVMLVHGLALSHSIKAHMALLAIDSVEDYLDRIVDEGEARRRAQRPQDILNEARSDGQLVEP